MSEGRDLTVFSKEQTICDIKLILSRIRVTHCLGLLDKSGLSPVRKFGKFYEDYLPRRLGAANVHQLAGLKATLMTKYDQGSYLAGKFSQSNDHEQFRIFISHSTEQAEDALELKDQLEFGGFECFVASDDIATASEWLVEIITQLEHMDALITLVSDHSIESPTCNQEVGFALGAGKPVLSVMDGVPPGGLIGSMQAIERKEGSLPKDVAIEAISALMRLPNIGPQLSSIMVRQLIGYNDPKDSFKVIGFCRKALLASPFLTAGQIFELRKAARENLEIARFASGRGPELIETLCEHLEVKIANI